MTLYDEPETIMLALKAAAQGWTLRHARSLHVVEQRACPDEPTDRERDVLHLVAEGLSNREIAEHLCSRQRTVQFHVANLFAKARARSRTHLLAIPRHAGWLEAAVATDIHCAGKRTRTSPQCPRPPRAGSRG